MLEQLDLIPADPLFEIRTAYRADPRTDKIDLGLGVYKNACGLTPVMKAVKEAEKVLHNQQVSKSYVGIGGDVEFVEALENLVLRKARIEKNCLSSVQTVSGSGALRLAGDTVKKSNSDATVWLGTPGWSNHIHIMNCLLYTSPSPRDRQKSRMPSSA